jgi:AraC family transcriptional regulator
VRRPSTPSLERSVLPGAQKINLHAHGVGTAGLTLRTGIKSFIRGFSNQLLSSSRLGWKDLSLELHDASPAERDESVSPDHLIVMSIDGSMCGEKSISPNRFIPVSFDPSVISLLPAGPVSACKLFTPAKLLLCAVSPEFMAEVGEESGSRNVTEFERKLGFRDQSLRGIMLLLAAEANSGGVSGRLYSDHLAHALALRMLWLSGEMRVARISRCGKLPNRVLQRVLERMKADLSTNLDLGTLVAESGYSRSHFLRMFRISMGCSPHQWLIRLRVEQAKTMLREKSLRMIDIAIACGFSSQAHFSNKFHQVVGMTPGDYRRQHSYLPTDL